ncbi:Uncharacterised protein [Vibrio cholerae]|nr:Uncharacterised protein [Vibrio cholerae]
MLHIASHRILTEQGIFNKFKFHGEHSTDPQWREYIANPFTILRQVMTREVNRPKNTHNKAATSAALKEDSITLLMQVLGK